MSSDLFLSHEFNAYQVKLLAKINDLVMSYAAQKQCGEWLGALTAAKIIAELPMKINTTEKVKAKCDENFRRFNTGFIKKVAFDE